MADLLGEFWKLGIVGWIMSLQRCVEVVTPDTGEWDLTWK